MTWPSVPVRAVASDLLVLASLTAAAVSLANGVPRTHTVDRAFSVLATATLLAAAVMLAFAAWLRRDGFTGRLAAVLTIDAVVLLPLRGADLEMGDREDLLLGAAVLGGLALLLSVARRPAFAGGQFPAAAGAVVAGVLALAGSASAVPGFLAADVMIAGVALGLACAVAIGHLVAGSDALPRRVGVGLAAFTVAALLRSTAAGAVFAAGLELAGTASLLVASAAAAAATLRSMWQESTEADTEPLPVVRAAVPAPAVDTDRVPHQVRASSAISTGS